MKNYWIVHISKKKFYIDEDKKKMLMQCLKKEIPFLQINDMLVNPLKFEYLEHDVAKELVEEYKKTTDEEKKKFLVREMLQIKDQDRVQMLMNASNII